MKIQPIVEGHGEVRAVPVLLRRLRDEAQAFALDVNPPIRLNRSDLLNETRLRQTVKLALKQSGCAAVRVMFDADRDCARELATRALEWVRHECGPTPSSVVVPVKEFEAWFLASLESLRGCRGVRDDAVSHPNPEEPRGAKMKLEAALSKARSYSETADQAAFAAEFDLGAAYRACRSFRKLVSDFGRIAEELGALDVAWPPTSWE